MWDSDTIPFCERCLEIKMTKIIYMLIMLALAGLALTAQTAYADPVDFSHPEGGPSPHYWFDGMCQAGRLVGSSGPTVCHNGICGSSIGRVMTSEGSHDGAAAERNVSGGDYTKGEHFDQGPGCPTGHSQAYCTNYKAGWESEFNSEAN
jgi:hypothetical protein